MSPPAVREYGSKRRTHKIEPLCFHGETSCRLLFPRADVTADAGDLKSHRLTEKVAEANAKGETSLPAKIFAEARRRS